MFRGLFISFVLLILILSCSRHVKEIRDAYELINITTDDVDSEGSNTNYKSIKEITEERNQLSDEIKQSNSQDLIQIYKEVELICNKLKDILSESRKELIVRHGGFDNGRLNNSREIKFVNQLFISENRGKEMKESFLNAEAHLVQIISKSNLPINIDELPLKLNLHMEQNGELWEEYLFQNMPGNAVLPILGYLNYSVIETEILVFDNLSKKIKEENRGNHRQF